MELLSLGKERLFIQLAVTSNWTGDGYYDLYKGDFSEGNLTKEQNFSPVLNSLLNESSPIFTRSLDTIYFTRNYQVPQSKEEKRKKVEEKILLEMYRSVRNGVNWSEPVRLPFNVTGYSVAHPALSPDGKYLYFAADINGTRGKSDIFRVRVNHKKGTFLCFRWTSWLRRIRYLCGEN